MMKRRMHRSAAASGLVFALAAGSAQADDATRVAVVGTGADGDAVASVVASRLAAPVTAADPDAFRSALGATQMRGLALAAKRHDKDAEFVTHARAAARSAHADKAIVVLVEKSKPKTVVHVWLVDAQGSGTAPIDEDVKLAGGASVGDEADAAWNAVSSAFPAAPAPSAPAETPAPAPAATPAPAVEELSAAPKPADADTGPTDAGSRRPHDHTRAADFATLGASIQGGSRHFSYVDRITPTLRPYDLFVAPRVSVTGDIYPFMSSSIPVLNELGATASFARAFGLASEDSGGTKVSTSWQEFGFGLRERLPLGSAFILGIDAGYGDTNFAFDNPVTPSAQLPSVHYKYLRGGLDGRFVAGSLSVHGGADYLDVLSTGDFAALFPRTSVGGVEASLGVADQVGPAVEVSLDLAYTRFFYNLQPQPGDKYVAGGALDEMATISVGVAYLF